MKTIRQLIRDFVYGQLETLLALVEADGKTAQYHGNPVFDTNNWFVGGEVIRAASILYAHDVETKNPQAEMALERIGKFAELISDDPCHTWGKLAILRGMRQLQTAGLLEQLDPKTLDILKEKTEYTDFFDKKTLSTLGYPSNYIQVAMACAGIREQLGWDQERFMTRIRDQLMQIIQEGSCGGWMDEMLPYGRFDRYSMVVTSELSDTLGLLDCELPAMFAENLREAARTVLFMANNRGDGINYGRSLSCYGDGAALEILASALSRGLVDRADVDRAVCYSIRVLEKILEFWYDRERGCINLWWDGRSTDGYRMEFRAFEVNMDMAFHLLTTLELFEQAGLADVLPAVTELEGPENWQCRELVFREDAGQSCKTIILRKQDTMVMLPLIGLGSVHWRSSYMPYPNICGRLEAAPESALPFLVPEYVLQDGSVARPIQYYTSISSRSEETGCVITANGMLCIMGRELPEKSNVGFTAEYTFCGDEIRAEFSCGESFRTCSMVLGIHNSADQIEALNFETVLPLTTDGVFDFRTPHGAMAAAWECTTNQSGTVGYRVVLQSCGNKLR